MKSSAKMGHQKVARSRENPCIYCGEPTNYLVLYYPYTKPSGVIGYRLFKGFAHVECLEDDSNK